MARVRDAVLAHGARPAPLADVELVDAAQRSGRRRPRGPRARGRASCRSGEIAMPSKPFERRDPRRQRVRRRSVGRADAVGQRDRRLQHAAARVRVEQERPELVAEPERAVACDAQRLEVEVAAGEQPVAAPLGDDRERHLAPRVAQRDPVADRDVAVAAAARLEVGPHAVDAQQERARVGLRAEAVVGHRVERVAAGRVEQRREAADRLARARRRRRLGVRRAGERRRRGRVGGQDRAPDQLGLVAGGGWGGGGGGREGDTARRRGQPHRAHGKALRAVSSL